MFYIITEDSNSARVFWDYAVKTFKGEKEYKLVPFLLGKDNKESSGYSTLDDQVENLIYSINRGDELLIAFDNIADTYNFNPANFISKTISNCNELGIKVSFTSYYCFEEVYLSYDELLRLNRLKGVDEKIRNTLEFVQKCLLNGENYFRYEYDCIRDFIKYNPTDAGSNREHFANQLLIEVTKSIKGKFKIIKSGECFYNQGACWILNCDDVKKLMINQYEVDNVCKCKCKFKCKECTSKEKLLDLNNHSMLMNSANDLTRM